MVWLPAKLLNGEHAAWLPRKKCKMNRHMKFNRPLKGPKREIFDFGVFAQIIPIWIGDLGTRPKN